MKTFLTFLLAVAGIFCLAFGTTARAQTGYQCTYNCTHMCGTYSTCWPAVRHCTDDGTTRNFSTTDQTLYGGCVPGGTGCTSGQQTCNNRGYTDKDCTMGCCTIATQVTGCPC